MTLILLNASNRVNIRDDGYHDVSFDRIGTPVAFRSVELLFSVTGYRKLLAALVELLDRQAGRENQKPAFGMSHMSQDAFEDDGKWYSISRNIPDRSWGLAVGAMNGNQRRYAMINVRFSDDVVNEILDNAMMLTDRVTERPGTSGKAH